MTAIFLCLSKQEIKDVIKKVLFTILANSVMYHDLTLKLEFVKKFIKHMRKSVTFYRAKLNMLVTMFLILHFNIIKVLVFIKINLQFSAIPIKIPIGYFIGCDTLILKFIKKSNYYQIL